MAMDHEDEVDAAGIVSFTFDIRYAQLIFGTCVFAKSARCSQHEGEERLR